MLKMEKSDLIEQSVWNEKRFLYRLFLLYNGTGGGIVRVGED